MATIEQQRRLRERARKVKNKTGKAYVKVYEQPARPVSKTPRKSTYSSRMSARNLAPDRGSKSSIPDKLVAMPLAHPVSKPSQRPVKSLAHPISMRTALDHPISKPTYNGVKQQHVEPPMPRTKSAYGTPKAAAAIRPKTTMSARTPPNFQATPTKEFMAKQSLGSKIKTAWAANKGNNERLAKQRMLKASRK